MTADPAHVAAVLAAWDTFDHGYLVQRGHLDADDATVAVEVLTPLIRAQVAAEIRAFTPDADWDVCSDWGAAIDTAARIAEGGAP